MGLDNYISDNNILEQNIIHSINKNLLWLKTDILSNEIENLSSLSLEELYNKLEKLSEESRKKRLDYENISIKIERLQEYLNLNLNENEEAETKEIIEKHQKEQELIDNKLYQNREIINAIEAEIEKRLNEESDSGELNNRFIKTFNDLKSQNDWKNNDWIIAIVIEKDWEESWKEIRLNIWWEDWKCLFRDNNGNFSIKTRRNNNNMEKEIQSFVETSNLETNKEAQSSVETSNLEMDKELQSFVEPPNLEMDKESQSFAKINKLKRVCEFLKWSNDIIKETNDKIEYNGDYEQVDESIEIEKYIVENADFCWIPQEIVQEYISKIKKHGRITEYLDENLKIDLWFDSIEWEIPQQLWCLYFYIKKSCPNRFREIVLLLQQTTPYNIDYIINQYGVIKKTIWSIKSYWDSFYEYLKFCSPFEGSYIKEWISHIQGRFFWETSDQMRQRLEREYEDLPEDWKNYLWPDIDTRIRKTIDILGNDSMLAQYFENFGLEPESINLFSFLKENPQTLENLWWKEIKSINLSIDSWINFAFRGIIEMVKSRPDIEFPHLNEDASELEKDRRNQQWKRIIKEYENMLRDYIAKDERENAEGTKNTFDKIFISTSQWWLDAKITDENLMPSKQIIQQFSWSEVADYSEDDEKYLREETKEIKMISDIENYLNEHPNEKILVCINWHGGSDGSSSNWRTKEEWVRLANISPNVKIRSIRCYFWRAFTNKEIYKQQSSLSWFSNNTPTISVVSEIIGEASNKNLWFHEMEIYTRLNYPISVSPLSESMQYIDWNTWKKEMRNIWLARNNESNWGNIHHNDYSHSV